MNGTKQRLLVAAGLTAALLLAGAVVAQGNNNTAPEARYVIDASTVSGMMGQGDSHQLTLRLGSRLSATGGAPKADHFLPEGMRMGASVPLVSPTPGASPTPDYRQYEQYQKPKGRMLIFWGCGAHAGPGQPVVIDFAKMAKGQVPPVFQGSVPTENGPLPGNSRTYGEWPNGKTDQQVSGRSSLIGQHRVAGNYSPEIAFPISQDFLAAPRVKSSAGAEGSIALNWAAVPNATGYYAWAMSAKERSKDDADMVWWASSATQQFGGGLWDYLSPATVTRLIGQKVVMPPSQTSCQIPAEVKAAGGEMMMGYLNAYGPEANFAFPERPKDPKVAWHPKWTAKVRYRAMGNFMTGMPDMGDMLSGRGEQQSEAEGQQQPKKKCKRGLGGLLRSAAGVGC